MQAARVIWLCTPKVFIVSVKSPIEPPPEIGRINANGRISAGKLMAERTGDKKLERASINPEARSIAETVRIAISGGIMETTVRSPISTPEIKVLYTGTQFFNAKTKTKIIKMGIT